MGQPNSWCINERTNSICCKRERTVLFNPLERTVERPQNCRNGAVAPSKQGHLVVQPKPPNDSRAAEEELNKQNTAQIIFHQQAAELSRARQQAAEAEMKQLSAEDQLRKAKLRAEEQESNQLRQKLADQQLDVAKRDAAEQQSEALRQKAAEEKVKRKAAEEALLQLQQQASEAAAREEAAEQERARIMEQVKHKAAETDDRLRALEADKLRGQMNGPNDKVMEQPYSVQNTAPHSVQTIDPHSTSTAGEESTTPPSGDTTAWKASAVKEAQKVAADAATNYISAQKDAVRAEVASQSQLEVNAQLRQHQQMRRSQSPIASPTHFVSS